MKIEEHLRTYEAQLKGYLSNRGLSQFDLEDVFQEIGVTAHKKWDNFDGRNPRAWLFAITRFKLREFFKAAKRTSTISLSEEEESARMEANEALEQFFQAQNLANAVDDLSKHLEEISKEDELLLKQRFYMGMTYNEILEACPSENLKTVESLRTRVSRILAKIRKSLDDDDSGTPGSNRASGEIDSIIEEDHSDEPPIFAMRVFGTIIIVGLARRVGEAITLVKGKIIPKSVTIERHSTRKEALIEALKEALDTPWKEALNKALNKALEEALESAQKWAHRTVGAMKPIELKEKIKRIGISIIENCLRPIFGFQASKRLSMCKELTQIYLKGRILDKEKRALRILISKDLKCRKAFREIIKREHFRATFKKIEEYENDRALFREFNRD